ncbi:hypothetical protein [Micromonospora sp. NPDC092111]|uniref:hypothetical protein n=1 Tax=Micromonospora sp. NPDC092111 TaxID=3364289 RepID=UPI00380B8163
MTTDEEQSDDVQRATWTATGDRPTSVPFDRRDYGDAEQLAEMTWADDLAPDEPVVVVDEPVPVPPPHGRAERRRNRRPLPR